MDRQRSILIFSISLLLMVSLIIILMEGYLWKGHEPAEIRSFERYVSGLGIGASISPEWGFISYDPRVDYVDETGLWPIPAGYIYSPQRGLTVGDIREIRMR